MASREIKVVIDNRLYDLTQWAHKHPGGVEILQDFHMTETTDYFYALHSKKAISTLKVLPSVEVAKEDKVEPTPISKLTKQLEAEGWMKPNHLAEVLSVTHTIVFAFLASYLAESHPFFAAISLAFAKLAGGWIAHSMDHSRDSWVKPVGKWYSCLLLGFTTAWWGEKHNRHHLSTNEVDNDTDIQLMPLIYLWKPNKQNDVWNRRFQHIYFSLLYALLFIVWEKHSINSIIKKKLYFEAGLFVLHYMWYYTMGWKVVLIGLLISGTAAAWVVTASHQSEEKLYNKDKLANEKSANKNKYTIHDFAEHQIVTTRNIYIESWFISYVCGGMQYQIEHHLFPRIPLYKLSGVRPRVIEFCKQNGFEYKEDGFLQIMKRNYDTIESMAAYPMSM